MAVPFVNFTPSVGSGPAAICELALERGVCHMGHDGKTGETLMKSVLAPMFAARNLPVMSWVGHNTCATSMGSWTDPANKRTKVRSKARLLHQILGLQPADRLVGMRVRRELGRLENGLGPYPLQRLPRHADGADFHVARLATRCLPPPLGHRPRRRLVEFAARRRETRPADVPVEYFFKSPLGTTRAQLRPPIPSASKSGSNATRPKRKASGSLPRIPPDEHGWNGGAFQTVLESAAC
jgi:hypothetical protein